MNLSSTYGEVSPSHLFNISCTKSDKELAEMLRYQNYSDSMINFTAICAMVFMTIGVPGNLVTIVALARYAKVRNATAISIINLSCSDLLYCCINLPLAVSTFYRHSWTYECLLCRIFAYCRYSLGGVSLLTVLMITINRYIMILHPNLPPKLYRRRYLILMLLSVWLFPFVIMIFPWFEKWGRFGLDIRIGSCNILPDSHGRSPQKYLIPIAFSLPMLAIVFCYARIFCTVKKSRQTSGASASRKITNLTQAEPLSSTARQAKSNLSNDYVKPNGKNDTSAASNQNGLQMDLNKSVPSMRHNILKKYKALVKVFLPTSKDKKMESMITAVVLAFCTCHLPIVVSKLLHNYRSHPIPNLVGYILLSMSPCINPVVYVIMSSYYRKAYKKLFFSRVKM